MLARAALQALAFCMLATLGASVLARDIDAFADHADLPREQARSGFEFLADETQALQQDDFANPGGLWVDRGEQLFNEGSGTPSCASCHAATGEMSIVGAATRYPAFDAKAGTLLNLEGRINACRTRHQQLPALAYESEALLSLSAYLARASRGMPYRVAVDGPAKPYFEQGRRYFFQRKGQLNLACNQCHDQHVGKWLRGERISQGQPTAFPGYRLEWQAFGSLHRRLQDCDAGIRAEKQGLGSTAYIGLELYLAWRAGNLPIESPGVRR